MFIALTASAGRQRFGVVAIVARSRARARAREERRSEGVDNRTSEPAC